MASEKETLDDNKPDEAKDNDKETEQESSVQGKEEEKKTDENEDEKDKVEEMQVDKKDKEDGKEEESDEEEEKTVKKCKTKSERTEEEPVTPISRPTRERKTVERFYVPSESRSGSNLENSLLQKCKWLINYPRENLMTTCKYFTTFFMARNLRYIV